MVNKCVSEAPESYYRVFVDVVDVGMGVVVVVVNVVVVALLVVTDHIISHWWWGGGYRGGRVGLIFEKYIFLICHMP